MRHTRWPCPLFAILAAASIFGSPLSAVPAHARAPAEAPPEPASAIDVKGAVVTQVTSSGACGPGFADDWQSVFELNVAAADQHLWLFQIYIDGYSGPGSYDAVRDTTGRATITLTNGLGTSWDSPKQGISGHVSVDDGGTSGQIDALLVNDRDSTTVSVSGPWVCHDPFAD